MRHIAKPIIALLTVITALQGVAIVGQAAVLARIVARLFADGPLQDVPLFVALFLARYGLLHVKQFIIERYADETSATWQQEALSALVERDVRSVGTGYTVTSIIEGRAEVQKYITLVVPKMINMAVIPLISGIYVATLHLSSAVVLLVTVPIVVAFMILLGLAAKKQADKQWAVHRILANHYVDSLRGLATLKHLRLSATHDTKIAAVSERYRQSTMKTLRVAFLSSFALDFFTMLSIATVALFLGLSLIDGTISLTVALPILLLAPDYFLPLREVGMDYHATLNGQETMARWHALRSAPPLVQESNFPRDWTTLHLDNVTVSDSPLTLSATLQRGEKIGVIGMSGAGKSSLIELLAGFRTATSGTIALDDCRLTHLQRQDWRDDAFYLAQHPYIIRGTVRDNLTLYADDATDKQLIEALHKAGLAELRLDDRIGDGGRRLSGGQQQRIALTRAFLQNRPVLLLDEPTAHLDVETEAELKETMLELFADKLVVLATHRLHWATAMDRLLIIDNGQLVEVGSHEQLLAARGHYYALVTAIGGTE